MYTPIRLRVGVIALGALMLASAAWAVRPPADSGLRPGPYVHEIQKVDPTLEPVADGFVLPLTGATAVLSRIHAGPFSGSPDAVALAYLKENPGTFALTGKAEDLVLQQVQESPGNLHVRLQQAVGGVPVWAAPLTVTLDETGRFVETVVNEYDPFVALEAVETTPLIDARRAESLAREAVWITDETPLAGEPAPPALWVLREDDRIGGTPSLAWRVLLPLVVDPRGDWEVFVDARSGGLLRVTDQRRFVDGSGYTFDPDPLTTAMATYGQTGYSDGSDADTPQLTAQRVLHTLRDLTYSGGLYRLTGPWVQVVEWDPPTSTPVTSATPDGFVYTRNQQGFEDVNGYFHIDNSQRHIQELGYNTIQHLSIAIDTHGMNGADNSAYYPGTNRITFGEGGVDDAEDADVLLHEYGHSIQNSIVPGWGTSTQARSMGEGFGDYWAGSYSASISSFRDYWVYNWDGHNPYWPGRVLNSPNDYYDLNGDIYHDGTIWASVWWLIRGEVGRTVCDNDFLKLHFSLGTGAAMQIAAMQAVNADRTLYDGLHVGSLDYFFTQRNFFTATLYDVPELTHTPIADQTNDFGPYPLTVTVASTSAVVDSTVKVRFGTGETFDSEVALEPTGVPNEYGGAIPWPLAELPKRLDVDVRYYIVAGNTAGNTGASPRGAEHLYHQFHIYIDPSAVDEDETMEFALAPANPNPFPAVTALRYTLPRPGDVRLVVHDVTGRTLRTLADGPVGAGSHALVWDGKDDAGLPLSSGVYFVRLDANGESRTRRVLLAR